MIWTQNRSSKTSIYQSCTHNKRLSSCLCTQLFVIKLYPLSILFHCSVFVSELLQLNVWVLLSQRSIKVYYTTCFELCKVFMRGELDSNNDSDYKWAMIHSMGTKLLLYTATVI